MASLTALVLLISLCTLSRTWDFLRNPDDPPRSQVRLVTYYNTFHDRMASLHVSAQAHHLYPEALGYGQHAWWPEGLAKKIQAMKEYAFSGRAMDDDIVIFADCYDVIVTAFEEEIRNSFERFERRAGKDVVVFATESNCYPGPCERFPESPTIFRYMNSGLLAARARTLKAFLSVDIPGEFPGGDQGWFMDKYVKELDSLLPQRYKVELDYFCDMFCAVSHDIVNAEQMELDGSRRRLEVHLQRPDGKAPRHTFPAFVHFNGWANKLNRDIYGRNSSLQQLVFYRLYPTEATRLFGEWSALQKGDEEPGPLKWGQARY